MAYEQPPFPDMEELGDEPSQDSAPAPQWKRSEQITELAIALAKAQGAMTGAIKDATNPHFKSSYADLASVWDACRAPLSNNGLSVVQLPEVFGEEVVVTTILLHASGQSISSMLSARPQRHDPQGIGSVITYLRRYSLSAMVGIAPEEDDGNAASGRGQQAGPPRSEPRPPASNGQQAAPTGTPPMSLIEAIKKIREAKTEAEIQALAGTLSPIFKGLKAERQKIADAIKERREVIAAAPPAEPTPPPPAQTELPTERQPGEDG